MLFQCNDTDINRFFSADASVLNADAISSTMLKTLQFNIKKVNQENEKSKIYFCKK